MYNYVYLYIYIYTYYGHSSFGGVLNVLWELMFCIRSACLLCLVMYKLHYNQKWCDVMRYMILPPSATQQQPRLPQAMLGHPWIWFDLKETITPRKGWSKTLKSHDMTWHDTYSDQIMTFRHMRCRCYDTPQTAMKGKTNNCCTFWAKRPANSRTVRSKHHRSSCIKARPQLRIDDSSDL